MSRQKLKTILPGIFFALFLVTSVFFLGQGTANAASETAAGIVCTNLNYSGDQETACEAGYNDAAQASSSGGIDSICNRNYANNNDGTLTSCNAGLAAGAKALDSTSGASAAACSQYGSTTNGTSIVCNYAYTLGNEGNGSDYCANIQSKFGANTPFYQACTTGYNASSEASASGVVCSNLKYTGSAEIACIAGYAGGSKIQNGDTSKVCSKYSNGSAEYNACEAGLKTQQASLAAGEGAGVPKPPSTTLPTTQDTTQTCEDSSFSLSWMVCPFVEQIQDWLTSLNDMIETLLTLNVNDYFDDSCVTTYESTGQAPTQTCTASTDNYEIWTNVRDIALSLLTIVALVMVIATALDIGPFDAYTVKKVMPRIVIAVIAITFSWELGRALVTFSNVLGEGVGELILSVINVPAGTIPAGATYTTPYILHYISSNILGWLTGGEVVGFSAIAGTVALAAVGPLALLMLLLPAVLALVLGFLILIARQLIVVICIIFAPFALISFVLPGSQKVFKVWQQAFFGAIFLFPMIEGAIAVGALLAYLVANGDVADYVGIAPFLALICLLAPYFLLPKIARMSTGALGSVANGINNSTQGLSKFFKQAQRKKMADSWDKAKKGDLWHGYGWLPGSHRLAQRTSAITRGVGTGWSGHYGVGARGRQGVYSTNDIAATEYMKTEKFGAIREWDDALRAKTYKNATDATKGLRDDFGITDDAQIHEAVEAARISGGFGGFQSIAAARGLIHTGTGYLDTARPDGTKVSAMQQMVETINRVSDGNASTATSLAGYSNTYTKQARPDLAPSFGALNNLVLAEGGHTKGVYGHTGRPTNQDFLHATDQAFLASGGVGQMLGAKSQSMKKFADRNLYQLEHGNQVERRTAALNLAELQGNITYATGDNREIINKTMFKLRDNLGHRQGFDPRNQSIYEQLAAVAGAGPKGTAAVDLNGNPLTAESIQNLARVYGDPNAASAARAVAVQNGPPGGAPPAPPPSPPGT